MWAKSFMNHKQKNFLSSAKQQEQMSLLVWLLNQQCGLILQKKI